MRIARATTSGGSATSGDFSRIFPIGNTNTILGRRSMRSWGPRKKNLSARKNTNSLSLNPMIDHGKQNVLGVGIDAVDYETAVERIIAAASSRTRCAVSALAVHGVMT